METDVYMVSNKFSHKTSSAYVQIIYKATTAT
jgi:hypothetical protein